MADARGGGAGHGAIPEAAARMRSELADVTIYLVRLADMLGVDLIEAARAKLAGKRTAL